MRWGVLGATTRTRSYSFECLSCGPDGGPIALLGVACERNIGLVTLCRHPAKRFSSSQRSLGIAKRFWDTWLGTRSILVNAPLSLIENKQ